MNRDRLYLQNASSCQSGRNSSASCMDSAGMTALAEGFLPGKDDVVCGRGKKCYSHVGNENFRLRVEGMLDEYAKAKSKLDKSAVLSAVVEQVRAASSSGGFVKQDNNGRWYEVGDFLAREKTSQAFRDALSDQYKSSNVAKKKKRQEEGAKGADKSHKIARSEFEIASRMQTLSAGVGATGRADEAELLRTNYDILNRLNRLSDFRRERNAPSRSSGHRLPSQRGPLRHPGRSSSYRFSETMFQPIEEDREFVRRPPAFSQSDYLSRSSILGSESSFGSNAEDREFRRRPPMQSRSEIIFRSRFPGREQRHRMYNAEEEELDSYQRSLNRSFAGDPMDQHPRSLPGSPQNCPPYDEVELNLSDLHNSMPNMGHAHARARMEPIEAMHHSMPNMQYTSPYAYEPRGHEYDGGSYDDSLDVLHQSTPNFSFARDQLLSRDDMLSMHHSMPNTRSGEDAFAFETDNTDLDAREEIPSAFDVLSPSSRKGMFKVDQALSKTEDMICDLDFDPVSPTSADGFVKANDTKKAATLDESLDSSSSHHDGFSSDLGICLDKLNDSSIGEDEDDNPYEPIPLSPKPRESTYSFEARMDHGRFRRSDDVRSPNFETAY